MRAAIFNGPRDITAGERPDAASSGSRPTPSCASCWRASADRISGTTAAIRRSNSGRSATSSSAWSRRSAPRCAASRKGDLVIAPFAFSDGTCAHCQHGITTACIDGGFCTMNGDGGQGEAVRVPLADSTLVKVPGSGHSDEMMRSLLALSDVMSHRPPRRGQRRRQAGRHGRRRRRRRRRALRRAGRQAPRRRADHRPQPQPDRQELAREFGATDIVAERGDAAVDAVMEMTDGVGVDAALECVGTGQAMQTAIAIARARLDGRRRRRPARRRAPDRADRSSATSACAAASRPPASTSPSCSTTSSPAASTRAASSTSRPTSTTSARRTPRWTSAARSSRSCG